MHNNHHVQRENSVTFLHFRILQGSVATYCGRGEIFVCIHRKFPCKSTAERILKIAPSHLAELLSNIKGIVFLLAHAV